MLNCGTPADGFTVDYKFQQSLPRMVDHTCSSHYHLLLPLGGEGIYFLFFLSMLFIDVLLYFKICSSFFQKNF